SVTSEENSGSKFTISLNLGDLSGTPINPLSFTQMKPQSSVSNVEQIAGRVLIVDDIKDIRHLVGFICQSFGLTVSYAVNGEHAITKIVEAEQKNSPFDCILMDIHMPVLDGKRCILKLREMQVTTPIIAVTAATMKGVRQELTTLGFNDVVAKPVERENLYQSLKACLHQTSRCENTQSMALETIEKHFLIIEDDQDAAKITALLLNSLHIKTTIADSAATALSLLAGNKKYDRILLDINLPDANGLAFSKELRLLMPHSHITIISGNDITQATLKEFAIDQALLKPINLDMLKSII
ncbi:response regulator, partial [Psychromonas sp.]|nr:response regulator [Psychromonas sp.]